MSIQGAVPWRRSLTGIKFAADEQHGIGRGAQFNA